MIDKGKKGSLHIIKGLILILLMCLIVPVFALEPLVAEAAAPRLNVTKKTITGDGVKYQLVVKNKVKSSKYKWTTSNKKVAKVSSKGLITSVSKGTAIIKCKITYPNRKTKTLSCKVTVKIPAQDVEISNAVEDENAHTICTGETYKFTYKFTPSDSSDKTYWSIDDESVATVDGNGVVTAKSPGITKLTVSNREGKEEAQLADVNYTIFLRVVTPTESVEKVELISSSQIQIVFSGAIERSTIINEKNELKNISIVAKENKNGEMSKAPGILTAKLSLDKKVLTITPSNAFLGTYDIKIPVAVKTTKNKSIVPFYKEINLIDEEGPLVKRTYLEADGLSATIEFNEAIDKTDMRVLASYAASGTALEDATNIVLRNKDNYKLSSDRLKLTIDLSSIYYYDRNKTMAVMFSGIKDLTGNETKEVPLTVYLSTNTSSREQIVITAAERTAKNVITAEFSDAVSVPGYIVINSNIFYGVVDGEDSRVVKYELSSDLIKLSGAQTVSFEGYTGYYVTNSGYTKTVRSVNFSSLNFGPSLISCNLTYVTINGKLAETLVLVYDKNIIVENTVGIISARVSDQEGYVNRGVFLNYKATVNANTVSLVLDSDQIQTLGTYKLNIPGNFVKDYADNVSESATATFQK